MNKAVPWNINGVGFDAREAAREAARRQGKSLGEWLDGVIADHAAELGIDEHEVDGADRIAAITSRLERLGARSSSFDRAPQAGRGDDAVKRRGAQAEQDFAGGAPRRRAASRPETTRLDGTRLDETRHDATWRGQRWRGEAGGGDDHPRARAAAPVQETDDLLEEALEAVEHRAQRFEKRTDNALASFAKMLEANEAKRDREREAVLAMGQKLSEIETRLSAGSADQNPIKGALARLEARLDTIGRRGASEATVRQNAHAAVVETDADAPLRRLEEKVNSILHAVARQQEPAPTAKVVEAEPLRASPAAVVAAQGAAPLPHRRLGDAIADISRRQRSLDDRQPGRDDRPHALDTRQVPPRQATTRAEAGRAEAGRAEVAPLDGGRGTGERPAASPPLQGGSRGEIASLASTIEAMRREMAGRGQPHTGATADVAGLRSDIATMSQTLKGLAPRGSVAAIEDSIKALTLRLEASREQATRQAAAEASRPALDMVDDLRRALAEIDPRKTIASLQHEVRSIGERIEGLNATGLDRPALDRLQEQVRDIRDMLATSAARSLDVEHIEGELSTLVERMDRQMDQSGATRDFAATADDIRRMIAAVPGAAAFDNIERRLEALAGKVDASIETVERHADRARSQFGSALGDLAQASSASSAPDMSGLERLVRELGEKIEAVRSPDAGTQAIEALQHQVTALASRFDDAEGGLNSLTTIERAMGDLFTHLEETRASVDTAAARAAREALRMAAAEGHGLGSAALDARNEHELAVLRSLQDDADKRTNATLSAVHETLEKVVGRLSSMEGDIADVRARAARPKADGDGAERPLVAPPQQRPVLKNGAGVLLGAPDPMMDAARKPPVRRAVPGEVAAGPRAKPVDLDGEAGRADFIAAARRAAHTAQNDPSVLAMKRPAAGTSEARAGLIARSREYVATHKKPVLLSIAAIFVVLGTLAIMQRAGFDDVGTQVASVPPARVQRMAALTPPKVPAAAPALATPTPAAAIASAASVPAAPGPGDLSPSALPKPTPALASQIPGSDPIQTGSIPSLPAFASGAGVGAPAARPGLPGGLKVMAENGDGAAQFELGASYAEGKLVPRDFATAARWYAKAADQGIAPAQYRLASLYEKGLGVGQDKARAKTLYLKAADAGNPRAMHNLAVMLADGDGKPDYDGAATWFRKAAQFGVHDSQFNLAILLARGLGVQQSLVQSYQWFAVAAESNDADAAAKRDEIASKLSANDLAVAKALAASFRPRSANVAATEVMPPAGGWDGAAGASRLNSARPKISSL